MHSAFARRLLTRTGPSSRAWGSRPRRRKPGESMQAHEYELYSLQPENYTSRRSASPTTKMGRDPDRAFNLPRTASSPTRRRSPGAPRQVPGGGTARGQRPSSPGEGEGWTAKADGAEVSSGLQVENRSFAPQEDRVHLINDRARSEEKAQGDPYHPLYTAGAVLQNLSATPTRRCRQGLSGSLGFRGKVSRLQGRARLRSARRFERRDYASRTSGTSARSSGDPRKIFLPRPG